MKKIFCCLITIVIALSFVLVGCSDSDTSIAKISAIYISGDSTMDVGDEQTLTITNDLGTTDYSQYHLFTSDSSVATIDDDARVVAVSAGETTISVFSTNGIIEKFTITVTEAQKEFVTGDSVSYSNSYQVFTFSLVDKKDNYLTANGNVKIVIKNSKSEEVYSKTLSFVKNDFTVSNSKTTCSIKISDNDITKGLYDTGTLSAAISTYDTDFSAKSYSVTNLPLSYGVEITNPTGTFSEYSSSGKTVYSRTRVESSEVECSVSKYLSGKISIMISITCTCTYLSSSWTFNEVGYKVYDEDGIIVRSSSILISNIGLNEKWSETSSIYLDIGYYTITLCDPS